jgi:3-hydroxyacyl-[acyl-carrier-protein] dehydratase
MPPPLIIDPAQLDLSNVVADREEIARVNPHRYEFALVDRVVHLDIEHSTYAGYLDLRTDAFWVRGHVPGRPLFPGVLMIECAAQLASYLYHHLLPKMGFLGFTGVDGVKFRGIVEPPCRFVVVGRGVQVKPRRMICASQGFVGDMMVFEGTITGMPV